MLAPDDLAPILGYLNSFHIQVRASDQLTAFAGGLKLHPLPQEAPWIEPLRQKTSLLRQDTRQWQTTKVAVCPQVLSPFVSYKHKFQSVAALLPNVDSGEIAAALLDRLLTEAGAGLASTQQARRDFTGWTGLATSNVDLINESIQEAWRDLGASEQKIVTLAAKIAELSVSIGNLEGVIGLDSMSSASVSTVSGALPSMVEMIYNVTVYGANPTPYLGVALLFFSLGKYFYDIFSSADQLHKQIRQLNQYSQDLTFQQQALAQTKSALALVYDLKLLLLSLQSSLVQTEDFWRGEIRNLRTVQNTLRENFSPQHPEILQLPIADSVWGSLKRLSQDLLDSLGQPADQRTKINIGV